MSMLSQTAAITNRYNASSPVVAANRSFDFLGAPHGSDAGPFEPPDINLADPSAAIWQRIDIKSEFSQPHGIGATAKTERRGRIIIDTYYPRFTSPKAGMEKLETAALLFHRADFSPVRCEDMSGPRAEPSEWENFAKLRAEIPFIVEDTTP